MSELSPPTLAVVLHDVAPATWPLYAKFVAAVDAMGSIPLTLLVVPNFHRQGCIERDIPFVDAMQRRLVRGDELVLHGYYHDDPDPVPMRPREFFMRRIYTREGEFYRLATATARARLELGIRCFHRLDWPVDGFVSPAWLLGEDAGRALAGLPFRYTSDPGGLIRLPRWERVVAPTLVWSARSAWRRCLSRYWNDHRLRHHATASLLRLGLHPIDMRHVGVRRYWMETLSSLFEHRTPMTKRQWLERLT